MVQKLNNDQIIVRIDMENGIPRVRELTGKELKKFVKTHQKSKLPTFSLEDVNQVKDPSMIKVVNNHSNR